MTFVPDRDFDHIGQGLSLIITQHRKRPRVRAWAKAYLRQCQDLEDAIYDVMIKRLLDWAVGDQLDMLGKIVGELRGNFEDADYKTFIRARIRINKSFGSIADVLDVLTMITTTPAKFREYRNACLYIEMNQIPDRDPQLLYSRLHETKAAGVKLTMIVPTSDTAQFKPKNVGASDVVAYSCGDAATPSRTLGLLSDALSVRDPKAPAVIVPGPPIVSFLDPANGLVEVPLMVTIHGSRFRGVGYSAPSSIHIGPSNDVTNVTDIVVVSDTMITCMIPPRDGAWPEHVGIYITNPYGTGMRASAFDYTPPPTFEITGVDWTGDNPRAGGTTILVHGFLFSDVDQLTLGIAGDYSTPGPVLFVVVDDSTISFTAPGGNLYTPYSVQLHKPDGSIAENNFAFEYTPPPQAVFTSISPTTGSSAGGYTVTGYGSGFTTVGIYLVEYQDISAVSGVTVIDDSTFTFTMRPSNDTGANLNPYDLSSGFSIGMTSNPPAGSGPDHGAAGSATFTFDKLSITSSDPESISILGGQTVTLTGTSLDTLTVVKLVDDTNSITYDCSSSITLIDQYTASFTTLAMPGALMGHVQIVGMDPGTGIVEGLPDGSGTYEPFVGLWRLDIGLY